MGFMELYGTNQSFIVELGFLGLPSDEDIQSKWIFIVFFVASVDVKMAAISLANLGSESHSQMIIFPGSFFEIWHSGCIEDTFIFNSVNNTCIFYQCLLWVFLQNHQMFWNQNITARNVPM